MNRFYAELIVHLKFIFKYTFVGAFVLASILMPVATAIWILKTWPVATLIIIVLFVCFCIGMVVHET